MTLRAETISAYLEELQKTPLSPDRRTSLAAEAETINEAVLQAATQSFGFFDEPSNFVAVLEDHAERFR